MKKVSKAEQNAPVRGMRNPPCSERSRPFYTGGPIIVLDDSIEQGRMKKMEKDGEDWYIREFHISGGAGSFDIT